MNADQNELPRLWRIATLLVLTAVAGWAQAPSLDVRPTAESPKIDGILDDRAWQTAAHSSAFRQVLPVERGAPTEETEFWITYDANFIYIGVRCRDSGGKGALRAYTMLRDVDDGSDDQVFMGLDTFNRRRDGYFFGLNAGGGLIDGLIQNQGDARYEWDGLWTGKVHRDNDGWSAELAIPVKDLSFDPANPNWGFNIDRSIRRKQELVRWAAHSPEKSTLSLPDAGVLRGIVGLKQGRGLDFKPYLSVSRHSDSVAEASRFKWDSGFDLIWRVSPSVAATFTVNTDFADAEVDERRVNLGRFPLFFPEKRAFFLQDASLFAFGSGQSSFPLPFYSRRIGLASDGSIVDLIGGLKLTGRTGPCTFGLLGVRVDEHDGREAGNLVVGRAALQVLSESSVGVILTHGDPRGYGDNTLVGSDFNYVNNRVAGDKALAVNAAVQVTDSDFRRGTDGAGVLSVNFPNEPIDANLWVSHVGERYDPALGYVPRVGVSELGGLSRYRWRWQEGWVNRVDLGIKILRTARLDGELLEETFSVPQFELETRKNDRLTLQYQSHREILDESFAIRPGTVVSAGDYRWDSLQMGVGTDRSRPVDVGLQFETAGYYGGVQRVYGFNAACRPSTYASFGLDYLLHRIDLPAGGFDLHVGSGQVNFTLNPDFRLSLLGQYDSFSRTLGANLRVCWTMRPGSELYFIVNQGYDTDSGGFHLIENNVLLKGSFTMRF